MVSKIAVAALVVIVACPILLGYAMNLNETSYSDYVVNNDPLDVSNLLNNNVSYTYAHGDVYKLNSDFKYAGTPTNIISPFIPVYANYISSKTSYPLSTEIYYNQAWHMATQWVSGDYFYEQFDYNPLNNSHRAYIYGADNTVIDQINNVHSFYYKKGSLNENPQMRYTYYYVSGSDVTLRYWQSANTVTKLELDSISGTVDKVIVSKSSSTSFADLSSGFYFTGFENNRLNLPENTKSALLTLNLNTITDASYSFYISSFFGQYTFTKSTNAGLPKWIATDPAGDTYDIYYDMSRINTYQIYLDITKTTNDGTNYYYDLHTELRYVGDWPTTFGAATAYITYPCDFSITEPLAIGEHGMHFVEVQANSTNLWTSRTPIIRIDDTYFRAYEYQIIENQTYTPSSFRSNPATTITNITKYGTSIVFGGNTYAVSDNKITLESRQIPVKDLVFSSTPSENGYLNKIGNTVISETLTPSAIGFNGQWSMNVISVSMGEKTFTKTEWTPGQFAWDGLDQNFLMVGLLSAVGVFIALGLVLRKAKSALWPLLIVCGGAAMLFFIML